MRRPHVGFTLAEVLIVMAIIGILMALLFPAIGRALMSASETQCKNHIGQLAKVVQAYCTDHDGKFPLSKQVGTRASASDWLYTGSATNPNLERGVLKRHEYIGDEEILYCPVDKDRGLVRGPTGSPDAALSATSYVINASITWDDHQWSNNQIRSRNFSDFDAVDFLFIEESSGTPPDRSSTQAFSSAHIAPTDGGRYLTSRHRDGGFIACMDGHVEWLSSEKYDSAKRLLSGSNWYSQTFTRPRSAPEGKKTDEEIASRWNPG